ncbi:MAG: hypothetical protein HDS51_03550 [Barnesiella sp.]|nr:hypothetical protein [Barnesiella sp.]
MNLKYLYNILCVLAVSLAATSCHDSDSTGEPDPPVPTRPSDSVHRTVLVYMLADNSLGTWSNDLSDLNEMLSAAATGALNGGRLIVYHSRPGTDSGKAPQLLEVTADGIETIKTYPDDPSIYSVDADRMSQVIDEVKALAPADDYGLVLWSHANGWMETSMSRSFGDDRRYTMKISSLAKALDGKDFSFIYFDCCSMASVEVMWELRHAAPVIVASGIELPADGMPYDLTLPYLFASGDPDVVGAAATTFDHYDSMIGSARTCAMTAVNTSAMQALADASGDIFAGVTEFDPSLSSVQPYFRSAVRTYMYDFEDYIERLNPTPAQIRAWRDALADAVVYKANTPSLFNLVDIDRYCGLGSYVILDSREISAFNYNEREWYRDVVSRSPLLATDNP